MTKFNKDKQAPCPNCKNPLKGSKLFQNLSICSDCYVLADRALEKMNDQLRAIRVTYVEALRLSLVRGELRPPSIPQRDKNPPTKQQMLDALSLINGAPRIP